MYNKAAAQFLKIAEDFKLGDLPTEQAHPKTRDLAEQARKDLPKAIDILKEIDLDVLEMVASKGQLLDHLRDQIEDTIQSGGRIFLYGCGATGRLSLSNGFIWRQNAKDQAEADKVVDFMSGGDAALIYSIESFEDHPDYGARQLRDLGFGKNDLLISTTEGGETPSVIGATEEAARLSDRKPFFMYCNPDDILKKKVERSRRVIENPNIEKICLETGPQALSGSTRMQASTALMLAEGAALHGVSTKDIEDFRDFVENTDFSFLEAFTAEEARLYQQGEYTLYETGSDDYGMTVITDTTERAPTFSLRGFENVNEANPVASLSYLCLPDEDNQKDALQKILLRDPVALEWKVLKGAGSQTRLDGFDFSSAVVPFRENLVGGADKLHRFKVYRDNGKMKFEFGQLSHELDVSNLSPLCEHILLKMLLNTHSTLVMGRVGRYEHNVMTLVKPSNNKLVDRSIRYVTEMLNNNGIKNYSYDQICHALFEEVKNLKVDEPIVLKTFNKLKSAAASPQAPAP